VLLYRDAYCQTTSHPPPPPCLALDQSVRDLREFNWDHTESAWNKSLKTVYLYKDTDYNNEIAYIGPQKSLPLIPSGDEVKSVKIQ
jgi:hypothetical protein